MDRFWMVIVDGTESCLHHHPTLESAKKEAERLVKLPENLGREAGATVLMAVEYCPREMPPIKWEPCEDSVIVMA